MGLGNVRDDQHVRTLGVKFKPLGRIFAELVNRLHQRLWRRALILSGLDYHHVAHIQISFISFGLGAWLFSRPAEPGLGFYLYLDVE